MSKGEFSGLGRKNKVSENVDSFIEGAAVDGKGVIDPKAKRDFKGIRVAFNEYEYNLLKEGAAEANLSLVAFIRTSWMARAQGK